MRVTLQYFNGCPNWKETEAHLEALRSEGFDLTFDRQLIETPEAAEQHGFRGSPTVLIDGVDPFADPDAPVGRQLHDRRNVPRRVDHRGATGGVVMDQVDEVFHWT